MATSSHLFGVTRFQLMELMSLRRMEGQRHLEGLGGVEGLMDQLCVNRKEGLGDSRLDLEERRRQFGSNSIPRGSPKSFIALAFDALQDKTLLILIAAALLSIVLGVTVEEQKDRAWIEGATILIAVVIVVIVTATNDWLKDRQFRGLQDKLVSDAKFSVRRDREIKELQLAEIVVGDIAEFKYGNTFPCDGVLIQGNDVSVNESTLTGEAYLVKKNTKSDPMLLAGTQVMEGSGRMLVTAVGPYSQQGIIFTLMSKQAEEDSGFLSSTFRKLRGKCCPKKRPTDEEEWSPTLPKEQVEERKYDPDSPPSKEIEALEEEGEGEGEDDTQPLTCCQKVNPFSREKKAQQKQRQEKEKEKAKAQEKSEEGGGSSVLQKKLNKLALRIGYAGTLAAILCFLILLLKFVIEDFAIDGQSWNSSQDFSRILHFVIIGITVLVVAVPEGLPLAITIALAYSVRKMMRDNNLVRHLHACETMGNATTICSDKTGTLTTNRMTVVESYLARRHYTETPSGLPGSLLEVLELNVAVNSGYTSKLVPDVEEDGAEDRDTPLWKRVLQSIGLYSKSKGQILGQGLDKQIGNVTECALLGLLVSLGIDYEAVREEHPPETFEKVFTFNSSRKSMTTVIPLPGGRGHRILTKGASEIVLAKCTSIIGEDGSVMPLTEDGRKEVIAEMVQPMAGRALRTLCLAYRDVHSTGGEAAAPGISPAEPDWNEEEEVVKDLTCIGVVGIQDPVRPEVPLNIKLCQQAGITVRMVTGDNVETARAIAVKCGIVEPNFPSYCVMDGKEFNRRVKDSQGKEVDQEKLDRIWPHLRVLARSSPKDKYVLVDGIISSHSRKKRQVVAVTGDGTNDGPALKRADVGFAMGIAGTDVAKEACDIILTDDNFESIVRAVMWGRNVYDSISKFLQFQLTVNIVAVVLALISAIVIDDSPLRAVQMLWVNLIMDTFASLALATESPTEELLERKPYGRSKALISTQMWLFLIGHSLFQLSVMFVLVFVGDKLFDIPSSAHRPLRAPALEHFTMVFNTFVFMQIFNEINARKVHGERNVFKGIHKNYVFLAIVFFQVLVQVILVEYGSIVFSTAPLGVDLWLWCVFLGSCELVWGQLLLLIPINKIKHKIKERLPKTEEEVEPPPVDIDINRARYLWVKSLNRLRSQIRVVHAFRSSLEASPSIHLSALTQYTSTPRASRYSSGVTGKETAV